MKHRIKIISVDHPMRLAELRHYCYQTFGSHEDRWEWTSYFGCLEFKFAREEDAVMFALRWV